MEKMKGLDKKTTLNSEAKRYDTCYNLCEDKKEMHSVEFTLANLVAKYRFSKQ